jgi:hypothetical protein
VFRLSVEMQRLEAVFNYETGDAPPLGSISVQVCACAILICSAECTFCCFLTHC